jgi:alcohol dehydrogenase, propanol-preferring
MRAAVLHEINEPLQIEEREDPNPKDHEVVVEVERSGLCHSDLHVWEGHYGSVPIDKMGVRLPLILGHEIAGRVDSTGENVSGFKSGDRVIVYPWIGDGTCKICRSGNEQYCAAINPLGLGRDGGFAEKVLVPNENYLVRIAENVPLELYAPLSCAGITAYSSVKKAEVKPDDYLLIFGIGGLGHMAVQLASALFKPAIIAVDTRQEALDLALDLGAKYTVNPAKQNLSEEVRKITSSRIDAAIDFVGLSETTLSAFKSLRRGGRLVLTGLSGEYPKFTLPEIAVKAVTISGTYVGNMKDLLELVALARNGIVKPMVNLMSFDEINTAFKRMREGRVLGRTVLNLRE